MRIVLAPSGWQTLSGPAAAAAIAAGWSLTAPADELVPLALSDGEALDPERLREALFSADLLLTGGQVLDWRSLRGSVLATVAEVATQAGVPVVVLAGRVEVGRRELAALGVESAYAVAETPAEMAAAADQPAQMLAALATRVARTWSRT